MEEKLYAGEESWRKYLEVEREVRGMIERLRGIKEE